MSDSYQALLSAPKGAGKLHGGASVLWGRHLVCRKLLAPPSVQQVHRALAPPLAAGGGRLRFQRPQWRHCSGGLSTCFTEPPATASAATTGTPAHAGLQRGGPASGSRCPSRPLGLSLCNFHHVVGAVVLGGRLWATRGSVPTGLCPGSVVTSRTAPCRAAVVTSCVFSICHSWCCSRLCGVK